MGISCLSMGDGFSGQCYHVFPEMDMNLACKSWFIRYSSDYEQKIQYLTTKQTLCVIFSINGSKKIPRSVGTSLYSWKGHRMSDGCINISRDTRPVL
jgi:hypothetical protein